MALKGHWQKAMPKVEGLYWRADRDGIIESPKRVYYVGGHLIDFQTLNSGRPWSGWWWSVPIEQPPSPEAWDVHDRPKKG